MANINGQGGSNFIGTGDAADGYTTYIVAADAITGVEPTALEVSSPKGNDTAEKTLTDGVIEKWTFDGLIWILTATTPAPIITPEAVDDLAARTAYELTLGVADESRLIYQKDTGILYAWDGTASQTVGVGNDRAFADDTTVAPATAGEPTVAEIQAFVTAGNVTDTIVYYTGDDLPASTETYVFHADESGVVTVLNVPTAPANNRAFADDTTVAPATAGEPTLAEIQAFVTTATLIDTVVYYTGDDLPVSVPTYVYHVDKSGTVTLLEKPTSGSSILTFDGIQDVNHSHDMAGFSQTFNNAGSWQLVNGTNSINMTPALGNSTITDGTDTNTRLAGRNQIDLAADGIVERLAVGATNFGRYIVNGSPEGVTTANVGSQALDYATGNLYKKSTGTGNTGWEIVGAGGNDRIFADDTTVAPATAGTPTEAEIATFAGTNRDTIIYYTGTDTSTDTPTYVFHIDASGNVTTLLNSAASSSSVDWMTAAPAVGGTAISENGGFRPDFGTVFSSALGTGLIQVGGKITLEANSTYVITGAIRLNSGVTVVASIYDYTNGVALSPPFQINPSQPTAGIGETVVQTTTPIAVNFNFGSAVAYPVNGAGYPWMTVRKIA